MKQKIKNNKPNSNYLAPALAGSGKKRPLLLKEDMAKSSKASFATEFPQLRTCELGPAKVSD